MTEHIVALFETEAAAGTAERDLAAAGIPSSAMRRYTPSEMAGLEPDLAAADKTETTHSSGGGFWAWLWGDETDTSTTRSAYANEAEVYDRRARAGNTVLSVMLHDESQIQQTITILDSHHPLNIDEHTHETQPTPGMSGSVVPPEAEGKTSLSPSGVDYSTSDVATPSINTTPSARPDMGRPSADVSAVQPAAPAASGQDEVIPLSEEQLNVGKRMVDRGTTHVRRYVVETPVERDVTLHGERVTIERRHPVAGTTAPGATFEERTVEVRETEEVPVVEKTARVVEEVAIHREATERTETVKDTVRREEVEIGTTGQNQAPSTAPLK